MLLAGLVYAAATGQAEAAQYALFSGGMEAVKLAFSLCGAYVFFGGLLGVLRASGTADALARRIEVPLERLFRFEKGEERALADISLNLSANMLGMGGAATAAGLSAMQTMREVNGERASDAMILFLVINTSSVQLFPATMVALRAQAGAAHAADIVLPTLLSTAWATIGGIFACRLCAKRGKKSCCPR